MQGAYLLEDTVTKATVELHNRFRDLCGHIGNSLSPMTLEQQAEHIANELRTDLVEFLQQLPAAAVITYASTPVVARIAVSGTESAVPKVSSSASALRLTAQRTGGRRRCGRLRA